MGWSSTLRRGVQTPSLLISARAVLGVERQGGRLGVRIPLRSRVHHLIHHVLRPLSLQRPVARGMRTPSPLSERPAL